MMHESKQMWQLTALSAFKSNGGSIEKYNLSEVLDLLQLLYDSKMQAAYAGKLAVKLLSRGNVSSPVGRNKGAFSSPEGKLPE